MIKRRIIEEYLATDYGTKASLFLAVLLFRLRNKLKKIKKTLKKINSGHDVFAFENEQMKIDSNFCANLHLNKP